MSHEHEFMLRPLLTAVKTMRTAQKEWATGGRSEALKQHLRNVTQKVDDMLIEIEERCR